MPEQSSYQSDSLSHQLSRNIPGGFFSPLSSPLAPVYIDCAHRLDVSAGESARLEMQEARLLVQDVVSSHPEFEWPEVYVGTDIRVRASKVLNHLIETHWLEDRTESLHERWVVLSPSLRPLLQMLRELAADSITELHSFADTLAGICSTLETDGVLDPKQPAELLRSTVNDLNKRLTFAIAQLHSVEKIVHGFERRQMQTQSGAETLQLVYGDFYEGSHMVCIEVLHRRGLLSRIHKARDIVRDAAADPMVKSKLETAIKSAGNAQVEDGWQLATDDLARLIRGLAGIRQRADSVDARIASFHQLSHQRFLYQSQMRGRRPEMVRLLCDRINQHFAGERFNNLDGIVFNTVTAPWHGLLAAEVEVLHGTASLRMPRRARQPVSLGLSDASIGPPDETELERLRQQMRAALTPARAARAVSRLTPMPNSTVVTEDITVDTEESLLDLVAAASFNHAFLPDGVVRWQTTISHASEDWDRKAVPIDALGGWKVERFTLTRIK